MAEKQDSILKLGQRISYEGTERVKAKRKKEVAGTLKMMDKAKKKLKEEQKIDLDQELVSFEKVRAWVPPKDPKAASSTTTGEGTPGGTPTTTTPQPRRAPKAKTSGGYE